MVRLNGALTGSSDRRLEDGMPKPSEVGGTCSRCGSSFVPREGADGLCRNCAIVLRRGQDGPAARRPEAPSAGSTGGASALPTCSVDDCSRAPSAFGKCRTHLDEERAAAPKVDPAHPWNKYVEKKTQEFALERVTEEPVTVAAETRKCTVGGCTAELLARGFCSGHLRRVRSAVERKLGSYDDKAFVERAIAGEFLKISAGRRSKGGSPPAPAVKAPAPTATSSPRTSSPSKKVIAPALPVTHVNGAIEDLPEDVRLLLALAELNPDARVRVVRWAHQKWGGAMIVPQRKRSATRRPMQRVPAGEPRACELASCAVSFTPKVATQRFCSIRCRNRELNRRYQERHRNGVTS